MPRATPATRRVSRSQLTAGRWRHFPSRHTHITRRVRVHAACQTCHVSQAHPAAGRCRWRRPSCNRANMHTWLPDLHPCTPPSACQTCHVSSRTRRQLVGGRRAGQVQPCQGDQICPFRGDAAKDVPVPRQVQRLQVSQVAVGGRQVACGAQGTAQMQAEKRSLEAKKPAFAAWCRWHALDDRPPQTGRKARHAIGVHEGEGYTGCRAVWRCGIHGVHGRTIRPSQQTIPPVTCMLPSNRSRCQVPGPCKHPVQKVHGQSAITQPTIEAIVGEAEVRQAEGEG